MADAPLARYRAPALVFAGFLGVVAASAAVLFVSKLGGTPARLAEHYRGAAESFRAPRSLEGLLEVAVPHLLAIPLVLFAASHVVGWARGVGRRTYRALVALSFGAALTGIASGFAVRFVAAELAWVKWAAFAALELTLLAWAGLLARVFLRTRSASAAVVAAGADAGSVTGGAPARRAAAPPRR